MYRGCGASGGDWDAVMSCPLEECVNGVLIDYRPQPDDPEFAVVVGDCPLRPGGGCEVDLPVAARQE